MSAMQVDTVQADLATAKHIVEAEKGIGQKPNASQDDAKTVQTIRALVLDCCQQFGIGHGGSAIGMAAIATALWKHVLRHSPLNPNWFDRDRLVMSNGHVALLQYIMLHLSGYEIWTMEQLKAYGHPTALNFTNITKTHPEIEFDGLDMSTGPLGQGIANSVGMAIANANLRAHFNTEDLEVIRSQVFCICGDACLQEGVALEAISLAGHLKLDNLVLVYDNNGIQCDGPITITVHEDINAKMRACGWDVIDVHDGNNDVAAIREALEQARKITGSPVFINVRTVIGLGTSIAGTSKAHHTAFGEADVKACKEQWNMDPDLTHHIPDDVRHYWADMPARGRKLETTWYDSLQTLGHTYPNLAMELQSKIHGLFAPDWERALGTFPVETKDVPTRQFSGTVYDFLFEKAPFIAGSADLSDPNFLLKKPKLAFGTPYDHLENIGRRGRYIHFGTREHGMIAIANGIAAYSPQAFVPITGTFAMFQLYGAAAIRMGALSRLQVIHIGTHDSIAEGACGPTHQPIELNSLFRATPNLLHIRPADAEEVIGAWMTALNFKSGPTVFGLNRHAVPLLLGTDRNKVQKGAYTIHEEIDAKITIISTGGDVFRAIEAAEILKFRGLATRVVSMPCMRLFEEQTQEYRDTVIPWDSRPVVSFEAMSTHGWAKWASASIGLATFGTTVVADAIFPHFKLTGMDVADRIELYVKDLDGKSARAVPWRNI